MPEAKGQEGLQVDREDETRLPGRECDWPADLDLLFLEQEDLLGQFVAKSLLHDNNPSLPSIALRAVRELVNRKLEEVEAGATHDSSQRESEARIEGAWRYALIEAQGRAHGTSAVTEDEKASRVSIAALADEIATYRGHLPELLREYEGRFVLIKGTEIAGIFPDRSTALREGYRRFGIVPLLVRQIAASDPAVYLPNVVP